MTPVPWPLIGRTRATGGTVTPATTRGPIAVMGAAPPKRPAWTPPYGDPSTTPCPAPGPPLPAGAPLWIHAETAALALLAAAGGDLHAHRTVHQEDQ